VLLPESERPFNPTRQTAFLLSQAQAIGPHTHALCQRLFDSEGRVGQRSMWGIVGLAKKYPALINRMACGWYRGNNSLFCLRRQRGLKR
jgi:hypothetical protein